MAEGSGEKIAMSRVGNDYRPYLIELVKAMGQEVINRAEQIVGDGDLITDLSLWLRFPQDGYPTMEINREHISREVIKIITGGEIAW